MDKLKIQLKKEIDDILEILYKAQESLKIYRFLTIKHEEDKFNALIHSNIIFAWIQESMLQDVILSLNILLNENGYYNIEKFVEKFYDEGEYKDLNIPLTIIQDWKDKILSQKPNSAEVRKLRNKYYAHKIKGGVKTKLSKKILGELIGILQDVFIDIKFYVYGERFSIKYLVINEPVSNLEEIIIKLSKL